jgi:hypothetical protein
MAVAEKAIAAANISFLTRFSLFLRPLAASGGRAAPHFRSSPRRHGPAAAGADPASAENAYKDSKIYTI